MRTLYIRRAVNVVGCILVFVTHVRYASVEPHLIEAGRQAGRQAGSHVISGQRIYEKLKLCEPQSS